MRPKKNVEKRAKKLLDAMPQGFEAALIGTPENRFYFLDFDAHSAGTLLVLPKKMVYIIDSRYIELAKKEVKNAEVLQEENLMEQLCEILKKEGVKHLYLDEEISLASLAKYKKHLPNISFNTTETLGKTVKTLREIKDEEELLRMTVAQKITDDCFIHIMPFIKEGVREIELALEMEYFMRKNGADGLAFDTICVAGKNTSLPHGRPGENRVNKGDFITLDFGAKYKGYCADMTRTLAFGKPSQEMRNVYKTVLSAHFAGIAAAKNGAQANKVDKAARDIIDKAGYKNAFGHGLGHALGIAVHEEPRFSKKETRKVQAGMVMSVEPGIYLEGKFGCRIEDAVLITKTGCQPLPKSPKNLIVL